MPQERHVDASDVTSPLRPDIEAALNEGWVDDTKFARSKVAAQLSGNRDGYLTFVTVFHDGKITWGVSPDTALGKRRRGPARSISAAKAACERAVIAQLDTLL